MLQKRGSVMKNKKIISLAALALTASLFLGACGGNKEEKLQKQAVQRPVWLNKPALLLRKK